MYWTYAAVFHDNSAESKQRIDDLQQYIMGNGKVTCIPKNVPVDVNSPDVKENIKRELENMAERDIPISGALVFGSTALVESFLAAFNSTNSTNTTDYRAPAILLAEDVPYSFSIDADNMDYVKGAFVASPAVMRTREFESHWLNTLSNVNVSANRFIQELQNTCQHSCVGQYEDKFKVSFLTPYSIASTTAVAATTKKIISEHCDGLNISNKILCSRQIDKAVLINRITGMNLEGDYSRFSLPEFQFSPTTPDASFQSPTTISDYCIYNYRADESNPDYFFFEKVSNYIDFIFYKF